MDFNEILMFIGRSICHQLEERTIFIGNKPLPICARDVGIYLGIFSSLLYIVLFKKTKSSMIPSTKYSLLLFLFILPLIYDGVTSYTGLRETTNELRLVTGILFGFVFPFFIIPLMNHNPQNEKRILNNWYELLIPLTTATILGLLIYTGNINYYVASILIVGTLIVWVSILLYAVVKKIKFIKHAATRFSISILLSVFVLSILSLIFEQIIR